MGFGGGSARGFPPYDPFADPVWQAGERTRLTEELAPGRFANLQTAGLSQGSPWLQSEQLGREAEATGGAQLGTLDDYMATARGFLGIPEAGGTGGAPAPGATALPGNPEAALTSARGGGGPVSPGITAESELGEFFGF